MGQSVGGKGGHNSFQFPQTVHLPRGQFPAVQEFPGGKPNGLLLLAFRHDDFQDPGTLIGQFHVQLPNEVDQGALLRGNGIPFLAPAKALQFGGHRSAHLEKLPIGIPFPHFKANGFGQFWVVYANVRHQARQGPAQGQVAQRFHVKGHQLPFGPRPFLLPFFHQLVERFLPFPYGLAQFDKRITGIRIQTHSQSQYGFLFPDLENLSLVGGLRGDHQLQQPVDGLLPVDGGFGVEEQELGPGKGVQRFEPSLILDDQFLERAGPNRGFVSFPNQNRSPAQEEPHGEKKAVDGN